MYEWVKQKSSLHHGKGITNGNPHGIIIKNKLCLIFLDIYALKFAGNCFGRTNQTNQSGIMPFVAFGLKKIGLIGNKHDR